MNESPVTGPSEEKGVAAVNRALTILDAFTMGEHVMTLASISRATGLYKSTVLRLLQSLEAYGYVMRLESGQYTLGAKPILLGTLAQTALHPAEVIMPVLRRLADDTRESASFYLRSGDQRLCAFRVDSPRPVRDHVQVGQLLPLDRGAGGHVLTMFETFTPAQVQSGELKLVMASHGERDSETAAVASPVFGAGPCLQGALSVSGPLNRFDVAAVAAIAAHVLDAAKELTLKLSGDERLFSAAAMDLALAQVTR